MLQSHQTYIFIAFSRFRVLSIHAEELRIEIDLKQKKTPLENFRLNLNETTANEKNLAQKKKKKNRN